MVERKIKDLSIALEALTRVQGVEEEFAAVKDLLIRAIGDAYKSYDRPRNDDDEIPF